MRHFSAREHSGRRRRTLALAAFGALAILACDGRSGACGHEDAKPSEDASFLRFRRTGEGEGKLETAVVEYRRDDGVEVVLVAAVHVGDRAYYKRLEDLFSTHDAVLYEMVKDTDVAPVPRPESRGMLEVFQRGMKDVLGLEYQLDAVDYTKKNFVHADLDPTTFFRLQKSRGESIFSLLFKGMMAEWERQARGEGSTVGLFELIAAFASDDSARVLKFLLAQQMEGMEEVLAGIEKGTGGKGSVIVTERNKRAMAVLAEEMAKGKKKLSIFYGAAHIPDLDARVRKLGFEQVRKRWVTAWDIAKKRPPVREAAGDGKPPRRRMRL